MQTTLRLVIGLLILVLAPMLVQAQLGSVNCTVTAVPAPVRSEGLTERLGDIVLTCTGPPNATPQGVLTVSLNTLLTGGPERIVVTQSNSAPTLGVTQVASNQISIPGSALGVGPGGTSTLRIANLRADATIGSNVTALLGFSPGGVVSFSGTQTLQIGVPQRGLLATTNAGIVAAQIGSPLPETITFTELLRAGTTVSSTRISEGFLSAFDRPAGTDAPARILLRFSGYPSDARLFVPDVIAGSNAAVPTAVGDFGGMVSGGQYVPGSNTLALVRMLGTDGNGAGGYRTQSTVPVSGGTIDSVTEILLANGSGIAVYEFFDSNAQTLESAQIPVFLGLPRSQTPRNVSLALQVSFGPLGQPTGPGANVPFPRFLATAPESDCNQFRDCGKYLPKLGAPPVNTQFRLTQGVGADQRSIALSNLGGGLLPFTVTVAYENGADWILVDPTAGTQPVLIRMIVRALANMPPGTYRATVTIDAGPAGVARYPVTLEIIAGATSPPPPTGPPAPRVTAVQNGASFQTGPVARGEIVTLRGENLAGASVTFDGRPARILFTNADQINLQVPRDLAGPTAQLVVTAGGVASAPTTVPVAAAAPGIFTPGIANQDGTVNGPANPASAGSWISIFGTGLLTPEGTGAIDAKLHDLVLTSPPYAGPAPNLDGLQQVNLQLPEYYPTMTTEVQLCTTVTGSRACSAPVRVYIRQAQ